MQAKKGSSVFSFLLFSLVLTLTILFLGRNTLFQKRDTNVSTAAADTPITVILDPGHGGEDGGATGKGGIYEKDINLTIAKEVEALLKMNGITVICTRNEDILLYDKNTDYKGRKKILDLAARLKISRETKNSIFISIHMNAFPQSQYRGLQVYFSENDSRSSSLALAIQNNTKSLLQVDNNRKIKKASSNIYLLDRIQTPAVLVECGFLSNAEECALLSDAEYQKKISLILADSISEFVVNNS